MSKSEENGQEVQSSSEIQELREEFQEYREITAKARSNRRVENIQVLVALGIVGAFISLYSSGIIGNEFWQGLITSPFWNIILITFISSNTIFLILKLITIPLMPVFDSRILSTFHEEVEPFLYLFSILGVLFAVLIRVIMTPFYDGFGAELKTILACASLLVPFLAGVGYSQAYRLSAGFQRNYPSIIVFRDILEELESAGKITEETNTLLMRSIVSVATPTPLFLSLIRPLSDLIDIAKSATGDLLQETSVVSENITNFIFSFNRILNRLSNILIIPPTSLLLINSLYPKNGSEAISSDIDFSSEDEKRLRQAIRVLRRKQERGNLDEEDILELQKLIEKISDDIQESDDE